MDTVFFSTQYKYYVAETSAAHTAVYIVGTASKHFFFTEHGKNKKG